jgi:hypothetical protein
MSNLQLTRMEFQWESILVVRQDDSLDLPIKILAEFLGSSWSRQNQESNAWKWGVSIIELTSMGRSHSIAFLLLRRFEAQVVSLQLCPIKPSLRERLEAFLEVSAAARRAYKRAEEGIHPSPAKPSSKAQVAAPDGQPSWKQRHAENVKQARKDFKGSCEDLKRLLAVIEQLKTKPSAALNEIKPKGDFQFLFPGLEN